MNFHSWQTLVEEARKMRGKEYRKLPIQAQYAEEMSSLASFPFQQESTRTKRLIRLALEVAWDHAGRPYYNIHPQMALKLARTNLDKIPARYIEIPENFKCIHIRFNEDVPIKMTPRGAPVHVMADSSVDKNGLYFRSALFGRFNFDDEPMMQHIPDAIGEDQFVLIVDEGFRGEVPLDNGGTAVRMLCNTIRLGMRPDETIPEAIERAIDEAAESTDGIMLMAMKERLMNLFRVIISTGFLANCPEDQLLTPEILAKDKGKYKEAQLRGDDAAIKTIVERAQRRGRKGWNVGTDELFVSNSALQPKVESTGTGKELQYSHIRSGHPHAVRYGPGKERVKIKWFRPIRVREDLPFKEE